MILDISQLYLYTSKFSVRIFSPPHQSQIDMWIATLLSLFVHCRPPAIALGLFMWSFQLFLRMPELCKNGVWMKRAETWFCQTARVRKSAQKRRGDFL